MSTKPKWTKGPWYQDGPDMFDGHNIHHYGDSLAVAAVVSNGRPPAEISANAHLIAAAPDLYERLETSTKTLILERDCYYDGCSLSDGTVPDDDDRAQLENLDAVIAANQAALARARGEA